MKFVFECDTKNPLDCRVLQDGVEVEGLSGARVTLQVGKLPVVILVRGDQEEAAAFLDITHLGSKYVERMTVPHRTR